MKCANCTVRTPNLIREQRTSGETGVRRRPTPRPPAPTADPHGALRQLVLNCAGGNVCVDLIVLWITSKLCGNTLSSKTVFLLFWSSLFQRKMGAKSRPATQGQKKPLKITAVGDGMVGKTCMLITYTENRFPNEYVPTVFDNYHKKITVDGEVHEVIIWDTAGQEDYERLRPLSYTNTSCFLLCYSVGSKASYDNIALKWVPELKHHCPTVPIILVATKTDLREENPTSLMKRKGTSLRRQIGACKYMECSALKAEGLQEIFTEAVRAATSTSFKKSFCSII